LIHRNFFRSFNLLTSLPGIRLLVSVLWKLAFLGNEMLGLFWRQPIKERYATENPFLTYQNFYLALEFFFGSVSSYKNKFHFGSWFPQSKSYILTLCNQFGLISLFKNIISYFWRFSRFKIYLKIYIFLIIELPNIKNQVEEFNNESNAKNYIFRVGPQNSDDGFNYYSPPDSSRLHKPRKKSTSNQEIEIEGQKVLPKV
jgi:hypothetical protein